MNDFSTILTRLRELEERDRGVVEGEGVEEGYYELPPIDRERYTDLEGEGLEGPFQTRSGKVVYYDPKEGKYYDRDSDMYLSHEEFQAYDQSKPDDYKITKMELPKLKRTQSDLDYMRQMDDAHAQIYGEGKGESEYTGKLHSSIDITRDVDEPNFCYDCKLISNTIGEIDNDSDETDVVCPRCGSEGYVEASPEEIEQYSNADVKEEDMREQRLARRVIELTQRLQSFKEQLAEMDPAAQDPEEIKKQQTITTNLNQMKAAGVDIDPSKGTEDPAFNKEVGSKVAAALADPALGQQLKGVLGKVKD